MTTILPKKDVIATGLVAVAAVLYLLWVSCSSPPGMRAIRATGAVILALSGWSYWAIRARISDPTEITEG